MNNNWSNEIKIKQEVFIKGVRYICEGYAYFRYDTYKRYKEIKLVNKKNHKTCWLEIEQEDGGILSAYLYESITSETYNNKLWYEFNNRECIGKSAVVQMSNGDMDLDIGEAFEFEESILEDESQILVKENWPCGEIEYSIGTVINQNDIKIGKVMKKKHDIVKISLFILILVLVVSAVMEFIFRDKTTDTFNCGKAECTQSMEGNCCSESDDCCIDNSPCDNQNSGGGTYYHTTYIRNSSSGTRNPVGGGTSFGK